MTDVQSSIPFHEGEPFQDTVYRVFTPNAELGTMERFQEAAKELAEQTQSEWQRRHVLEAYEKASKLASRVEATKVQYPNASFQELMEAVLNSHTFRELILDRQQIYHYSLRVALDCWHYAPQLTDWVVKDGDRKFQEKYMRLS